LSEKCFHLSLKNRLIINSRGMTTQTTPTTAVLDAHKRLLIRNQLLLILHSKTCHSKSCPKTNCSTVKTVLQHMKSCTAANSCPVAHCLSTRQISSHWHNCVRTDTTCEVCSPLKERYIERKAELAQQSGGTVSDGKHWHSWITRDVRNRLIEKLVLSLISSSNVNDLEDMTVRHVFNYAFGIEEDIYKTAENLVQYHHLFWQKIYIIENNGKRLRQLSASVGDVTKGFDCLVLESMLESDSDFRANVLN